MLSIAPADEQHARRGKKKKTGSTKKFSHKRAHKNEVHEVIPTASSYDVFFGSHVFSRRAVDCIARLQIIGRGKEEGRLVHVRLNGGVE